MKIITQSLHRVALIVLLQLISVSVFSQYLWSDNNYPEFDAIIQKITDSHEAKLKNYENKKLVNEINEWRVEYLKELHESHSLIYNDTLQSYINSIATEIKQSNPILDTVPIWCFVSNNPIPNATSIGDGVVIINLGLIRRIENRGELAFILSHEISHVYLDHSNLGAISRHEKITSSEYKKAVKKATKKRYGSYELTMSFLKNQVYENMSYSREDEISADSMGVVFLIPTNFNSNNCISSLLLLDKIDHYKYSKKIDYKKVLGFDNYPFKERWLESESSIFGGTIENDYWNIDSIKTHPECVSRIEYLKNIFELQPVDSLTIDDDGQLRIINKQSDLDYLKSWIYYENYAMGFFQVLKFLEHKPANTTGLLNLSDQLRLICEAQQNHQLSDYVQKPSVNNEPEYDELLNFLDNISLSELTKIGYNYHLKYLGRLSLYSNFTINYNYFKDQTKQ
jgi:peptidase M48-like protein